MQTANPVSPFGKFSPIKKKKLLLYDLLRPNHRSTAQMWTPDLWSPTLLCTYIQILLWTPDRAGPGCLPKYGVRDPWETRSISIVQTLVLQRSRSWGTEKTLERNPRSNPYRSFVWELALCGLVAQAFRVSSEGFWSRGCWLLRDCF
jgi:hypothetical protein